MNRLMIVFAVVFVIGAFVVIANAGNGCCPSTSDSAQTVSALCPVMKNKIPDVTKASGKSVYKGQTYYFCCKPCKPKFDKDPAKYVERKSASGGEASNLIS